MAFVPCAPMEKMTAPGSERTHVLDGQVLAFADGDVAEVMHMRLLEKLPVLFPEPAAQFELARENAIFREPAKLDIAIQDDDLVASAWPSAAATAMPAGPAPATMRISAVRSFDS